MVLLYREMLNGGIFLVADFLFCFNYLKITWYLLCG